MADSTVKTRLVHNKPEHLVKLESKKVCIKNDRAIYKRLLWDNMGQFEHQNSNDVMNGETTENIRTHEFIPIIKRQINKKDKKVP